MPRLSRALPPIAAALLLLAPPAHAAEAAPHIEPGDVCWVLLCAALVMLMTIPGLALFYAGMVRKKNVLATMMQSFFICALGTILWMVAGYSLAFGDGNAWIGDVSRLLLNGIAEAWDKPFTLGAGTGAPLQTTIPESVFVLFQMAFAIITPAVVTGGLPIGCGSRRCWCSCPPGRCWSMHRWPIGCGRRPAG